MQFLKNYSVYILMAIIAWLGFAAIASAGVNATIKDYTFLKFVFWIALVVGGWVVSGAVSYTVVKNKISMHDKGIFTLGQNLELVKGEFNDKLYSKDGSTIYMPKKDCDKEQSVRERRHDDGHGMLLKKIDSLETTVGKLSDSQNKLAESVSNLVGRFDQYLDEEEKRNNKPITT